MFKKKKKERKAMLLDILKQNYRIFGMFKSNLSKCSIGSKF